MSACITRARASKKKMHCVHARCTHIQAHIQENIVKDFHIRGGGIVTLWFFHAFSCCCCGFGIEAGEEEPQSLVVHQSDELAASRRFVCALSFFQYLSVLLVCLVCVVSFSPERRRCRERKFERKTREWW